VVGLGSRVIGGSDKNTGRFFFFDRSVTNIIIYSWKEKIEHPFRGSNMSSKRALYSNSSAAIGGIGKRLKLENDSLVLSDLPEFATKLNLPMLTHQNHNLAVELFSAKRRIRDFKIRQEALESDRNHLVDCIGLLERSWTELDSDLKMRLCNTSFGESNAKQDNNNNQDALTNIYLPEIRLVSVLLDGEGCENDSGDESSSSNSDADQKGQQASEKGKIGIQVQSKALVKSHLRSRVELSKRLTQTIVSATPDNDVMKAVVDALRTQRPIKAKLDEHIQRLEMSTKLNADLQEQLVLCKFQRDRAKSKLQVLKKSTVTSPGMSMSTPASPASPAASIQTTASSSNISVGKTSTRAGKFAGPDRSISSFLLLPLLSQALVLAYFAFSCEEIVLSLLIALYFAYPIKYNATESC
jgi:hypothetical protein